jgi:hypothetical protein
MVHKSIKVAQSR